MKNNFCKASVLSLVGASQAVAAPFSPEAILPDGSDFTIAVNPYTQESGKARKGIIAATLNNVVILNQLLAQENSSAREEDIKAVVAAIDQLIPSLSYVGMFDFFEPVYWIGQGEQIGRIVTIALYFKHYPEKSTPELKQKVSELIRVANSSYLLSIV